MPQIVADPPLNHIDKAAGYVVDQEIPGYRGEGWLLRLGDPLTEQAVEISFEILEKKIPAFTGKDADNVFLAVPQMEENVGDDVRGGAAGQGEVMRRLYIEAAGDDMIKNVGTQFLEQVVLGLKVGVKGGAAHIGLVNDVLHGDLAVTFAGEKLAEGAEDRRPGFLLPSVQKKHLLYNLSILFVIAQRKIIIR